MIETVIEIDAVAAEPAFAGMKQPHEAAFVAVAHDVMPVGMMGLLLCAMLGATIEDDVLIAMGAILLNGVKVGTGSIIGAGAVVREGFVVPPNSLVVGVPGKIIRETTPDERARIAKTVESYLELQKRYR